MHILVRNVAVFELVALHVQQFEFELEYEKRASISNRNFQLTLQTCQMFQNPLWGICGVFGLWITGV